MSQHVLLRSSVFGIYKSTYLHKTWRIILFKNITLDFNATEYSFLGIGFNRAKISRIFGHVVSEMSLTRN